MLYQELPQIESSPIDGWERWLSPALVAAAGLTIALLVGLAGAPLLSALAVAVAGIAAAALVFRRSSSSKASAEPLAAGPDFALLGSALGLSREPVALTSGEGSLLIANAAYRERFDGARPPLELAADEDARQGLRLAQSMAWRDGAGCVAGIATSAGTSPVEVERVGSLGELLLWRFPEAPPADPLTSAVKQIDGLAGERLTGAGVLAAVVDGSGKLLAANRCFVERAIGPDQALGQTRFSELVEIGEDDQIHLVAEGEAAQPIRAVHLPAESDGEEGAGTFLLFDSGGADSVGKTSNLQTLLDVLPIGLALVDRDGRFLTMNQAFRQAAGLGARSAPVYPGDLVVKEDKAAVADAVRRNSRGPAMSGDLAVRLARQPGEPVALTIAGLRGLGDAAVLLLLKDNSEEAKLKRQVAQATKMQVVGQLAGGVAHDFNNILTAIIGHCDLMLMRHTPGDSDYDDIQQIKSNSNRAAGLTRQLLAFSRQQTLRPQVLQLPDVVSEVSHLLKRLLGETVELVLKHGRNLGPIRADPGQLEQVIINLAVNARDAMAAKGGGTLTIQTYSVKADQ
ncbi:MAG TPA: histidine kinase dimerization/phospho-acceptor domain-containing protein, partial [Sphingomicrobium sp.]|nr:histidine kinase dimerization/phospho-acceptor domain-containing protein [Sphingomicrobium sp.]